MSHLNDIREMRQWLGELRRWAALIRPTVGRAFKRGRLQAKVRRSLNSEGGASADAVAALCALGFKRTVAEIAVREALAELGDVGSDVLIRDALRRIR